MIFVVKPSTAPAVLLTRGTAAARAHSDAHDTAPSDYRNGAKKFDFDKTIYAAREVKDALVESQKKKCAFCESLIRHVTYGAVEHFRPKAGYKQRRGDSLKRPGYYWLAYEWDNLLFCCQLCNEQFKQNHFPLRVGRNRARSPAHRLDAEDPLLIHPARIDPMTHIGFRRERAIAVHESLPGKTTIRLLGLNRPELIEARIRRLQQINNLLRVRELLREKITAAPTAALRTELSRIEGVLQGSQSDAAEYAAMVRSFLAP